MLSDTYSQVARYCFAAGCFVPPNMVWLPYRRLISRGETSVDWIVKTFCGYIFEGISTISTDKFHCLKIFVVKISRIEQYLRKPGNFHPLKFTRYKVYKIIFHNSSAFLYVTPQLTYTQLPYLIQISYACADNNQQHFSVYMCLGNCPESFAQYSALLIMW